MDFTEEVDPGLVFIGGHAFAGFPGCHIDGFRDISALILCPFSEKDAVFGTGDGPADYEAVLLKRVEGAAYGCAIKTSAHQRLNWINGRR